MNAGIRIFLGVLVCMMVFFAQAAFASEEADAEGFSSYTIEFTYGGMQYVMDGDSSVALADVLTTVGLEGEVSSVEASNDKLFSAEKKDGEWMVTAHKAFTSTEWMKVTVDGVEYEIVVTDTIPGNDVSSDVTMYNGEEKAANFKITTGTVLGPNNSGTATIRDCTVTNEANNVRTGQVSGSAGSAFIAQKPNNLLFDGVTINSSTKSLVINIWANASAELRGSTLDGTGVEWGDLPFLLIGGYGGAAGTLNVNGNSTIKNTNGAIDGGSGGSVINVKSGMLTIENSKIALKNNNHFVVENGATLILDKTELDASGCTTAPAIEVKQGGTLIVREGSVIKKYNGSSSAITATGATVELTGSTFENNKGSSGGVLNAANGSAVTITDGTIKNNMASNNGGSIAIDGGTLNILGNTTFDNNICRNNGGAIYANNTTVTIGEGVEFTDNHAGEIVGTGTGNGGALYLNGCTTTIGSATFDKNGTYLPEDSEEESFDPKTGIYTQSGGAINATNGTLTIEGTTFTENVSLDMTVGQGSGGAIHVTGTEMTISGATFTDNAGQLYGGAVTLGTKAKAIINDLNGEPTRFTGNAVLYGAEFAGGAICIHGNGTSENDASLSMEDAAIYDNYAQGAGGGISTCQQGTSKVLVMDGAVVYNNTVGDETPVSDAKDYSDIYIFRNGTASQDNSEVYERMFNGGLHNWNDKTVDVTEAWGGEGTGKLAKSNPTNTDISKAKVIFTGNKAMAHSGIPGAIASGGAISNNGLLQIGSMAEIKIVKLWDDKANSSTRPSEDEFLEKVTILANGEEVSKDELTIDVITENVDKYSLYHNIVDDDGEPVDFGDKEPWLIIVSGLPIRTESGEAIEYTIEEGDLNKNYKLVNAEGDMETYFKLENKVELIEIPVEKIWDEDYDYTGFRPEEITINLLADGEKVKELKLSESNQWKGEFKDLVKYDGDQEIKYTVEEVMEGDLRYYTCKVNGDADSGFTITNSLELYSKAQTSGVKTWDGDDGVSENRPSEIKVALLEDGGKVRTITVSEEDGWKYGFGMLPKNKDGERITYSLAENSVDDYEASYDGFDITNTYTGEKPKDKENDDSDDQTSGKGKGVGTGDNAPVVPLIALLAACAAAAAVVAIRRRKQIDR